MSGQMSYGEIEQLWINNGGNPVWAPLFAAIAEAESGGDSTALNNNPNTGDYSVGLWQINYYGNLLSSRTHDFGPPAQLQADANAQAKAAIALSNNGTNLGPWKNDATVQAVQSGRPIPTQYTNGAKSIKIPANPLSPTDTGSPPCAPAGPNFPVIGQVFTTCSVKKATGVTLMAAGGLVFFVGLALLAASTGAGRAVQAAIPSPARRGAQRVSQGSEDADFETGRSQGRRQEIRKAGRETGRREIGRASEAQERAEGFPGR